MPPTLGMHAIENFERRGISAETAVRFGIYTASRIASGEVIPDTHGNIIVFPFWEHGKCVNEKFRAQGKRFWQTPGGRRTFYNSDVLDDPNLATGQIPLVVTEGEIDALTAVECGFPCTVSVPDGAPGVPQGARPDELEALDSSQESAGKFAFIWNNRDRIRKIRRFILAVDSDPPGVRLAAELVRRFSAARCSFVTYPEGCKDLNDVWQRHGASAVVSVLNSARPYPVRGLYRLADYPEVGALPTVSTGWWTLDRHVRIFAGEFLVMTGIPGMGKSVFMLNLLCNLALLHSWPCALFSPEMPAVPHVRNILTRFVGETDSVTRKFLNEYFRFIDADPTGSGAEDEPFDLDWIIDRATDAVLRDGVRVLCIDPWNEVEHARLKNETVTDYIGRSIRALKRFAKLHDVAVFVIAHPTKDVSDKKGASRVPTLYDVDGSANWFNKCDHGLVVDRPDAYQPETVIHVRKVRFEGTGERGEVRLRYDRERCRFNMLTNEPEPELFV